MTHDPVTVVGAVRHAIQRGLLGARAGALHFPAYFLGLEWDRIAPPECVATIAAAPATLAGDGAFAKAVVALLADVTLGAAARLEVGKGVALSTVTLELDFVEADVRAQRLTCSARSAGRLGALATAVGELSDEHGTVLARVRARFIVRGLRDDHRHRLYPWEAAPPPSGPDAPPAPDETEIERFLLARLDHVDGPGRPVRPHGDDPQAEGLFARVHGIETTFDDVRRVATARQPLGAHVTNRTGIVQGGFLAGLAAEACAAAGRGATRPAIRPLTLECTFVRPGRVTDSHAEARAQVVHGGRRLTVVHGQVTDPQDRVLLHCRALLEGPGE